MAFTEKYASVAGAGAHDGSSEGNAWTLAQAAANAVAGDRVNVKAGTYNLGASATLPSGSSGVPVAWRGYSSAIGDLESVGRTFATGPLSITNFPLIDGLGSYSISGGAYNHFTNLYFTDSGNGTTFAPGAANVCWRCRFTNTHATGSSARALGAGAVYGSLYDCDFVIASDHSSARIVTPGRSHIQFCRVWNSATPGTGQIGISGDDLCFGILGNLVFNVGIGIVLSGYTTLAVRNLIYNTLGNGINCGTSGGGVVANLLYSIGGYGISLSGGARAFNNAMGALTSGRITGTTYDEKGGISLTASPFTNAGSEDFTLNNTAGGGALVRAAFGVWGGFGDVGPVQHQDSGGSGVVMAGDMRGGFANG